MNIENSLKKLGLSSHNIGTSTGSNYFSNGDSISSYSPVDGKEIGNAPIKGYSVKPGLHEVRLEADGYAPATHEISVQDAKRLVADFILNPMYKINVSLGFEPVPFSLEYMKQI